MGPAGSPQRLGRAGEAVAEGVLRRAGLRILDRRFRSREGEIDLVAEDGAVVVFVEVKTRSGGGYGSPAEAVTGRKRGRMARAALAYLASRRLLERPSRFDVVEVLRTGDGLLSARHIVDAFRLTRSG